jgi:hypothetical protein
VIYRSIENETLAESLGDGHFRGTQGKAAPGYGIDTFTFVDWVIVKKCKHGV